MSARNSYDPQSGLLYMANSGLEKHFSPRNDLKSYTNFLPKKVNITPSCETASRMEQANVKVSKNVKKQNFLDSLQIQQEVKDQLLSSLKKKRKILDKKNQFGKRKNQKERMVDFSQNQQNWQDFMVIYTHFSYIFITFSCD